MECVRYFFAKDTFKTTKFLVSDIMTASKIYFKVQLLLEILQVLEIFTKPNFSPASLRTVVKGPVYIILSYCLKLVKNTKTFTPVTKKRGGNIIN